MNLTPLGQMVDASRMTLFQCGWRLSPKPSPVQFSWKCIRRHSLEKQINAHIHSAELLWCKTVYFTASASSSCSCCCLHLMLFDGFSIPVQAVLCSLWNIMIAIKGKAVTATEWLAKMKKLCCTCWSARLTRTDTGCGSDLPQRAEISWRQMSHMRVVVVWTIVCQGAPGACYVL